jgi:cytochrome c oxidase assembly protein subunit 15
MTNSAFSDPRPSDRPVAVWLFAVAAMIFAMVIIGGATRLTESGLSIVTWRPITGWLPPLNEAEWQALFAEYRKFPQFLKQFPDLTLAGFKEIFWLEYIHRVWGRLIGVAFLLPFLWFLVTRRIRARMVLPLLLLFLLGGAQGALGWWMVQSGLVKEPAVSQYRLAAHLGLAIVLYVAVLWVALGIARPRGTVREGSSLRAWVWATAALVFITVLSGAFVAGLDAGKVHNTFPRMGGQWIPADYMGGSGVFANAFENPVAVQFHHRVLALLTTAAIVLLWFACFFGPVAPVLRGAATVLLLALALQVFLGIETLLAAVPVWLGVLHQAGAMLLVTAMVWMVHNTYGVPATGYRMGAAR